MARRRERCNGCGHQAVTGHCPGCQAVSRFQPFEPQVHAPSAPGPRCFSRTSGNTKPNMLAAAGLDNNRFKGVQPFEPRVHAPSPRWFDRVSANINPTVVGLDNNRFNGLQPFEPRVHAPSPRRFDRVSANINPTAAGSDNNRFNGLQPFEPRIHAPSPRRFDRVSANINPDMVLLNSSFNNFADKPRPRPALPPPPVYGRKKALLCGVNYNGTSYKLSGCVNDVKRIRFLLVDTFGFPSDAVLILTENERNPRKIPTKQNMRSAMTWLVQDCQPGDSLFFHYSGHGLRQKDYNQDEIDGFDEAICPIDFETEGPIIDDEINAKIVRPLPRGVKLHAVIDTCFSGTVLDLPFMCRISREGHYVWEYQRSPITVHKKGTSGGIALSFSACDDHQTSASTSAFTGREVTSAMTSSFIQAVQNEPGLTYGRLLNAMHHIIPSLVPSDETNTLQEPQLCSSETFDIYSTQFIL